MKIWRVLLWVFTLTIFIFPLNWIRLWVFGGVPDNSTPKQFLVGTLIFLGLGAGLLFFLLSSKKKEKLKVGRETAVFSDRRTNPPGPATLVLNYVDADGVPTTRQIAPFESGATNRKFGAWCYLRQEQRTFLFNRIESGIDLYTGEVLSRSDIFKRIHPTRSVPFVLR